MNQRSPLILASPANHYRVQGAGLIPTYHILLMEESISKFTGINRPIRNCFSTSLQTEHNHRIDRLHAATNHKA